MLFLNSSCWKNHRRRRLTSTAAALLAAGGALGRAERPRSGAGRAGDPTAGLRTFGGIGKERPILEAGKEVELFRHAGAGCLTHMWFAMDSRTRIRVYVDGETAPSIDMAQDLGHGYAHGGPPEPWGVPRLGRGGGAVQHLPHPVRAHPGPRHRAADHRGLRQRHQARRLVDHPRHRGPAGDGRRRSSPGQHTAPVAPTESSSGSSRWRSSRFATCPATGPFTS